MVSKQPFLLSSLRTEYVVIYMLGGTYIIASEIQKHKFLFLEAPITQTLNVKNKALRTTTRHVCLHYCLKMRNFKVLRTEATDALAE